MGEEKKVTCIICPIGCKISVELKGKQIRSLRGNKCKKGETYAMNEIFDPRRVLTTSVLVKNGEWPLVSVKTSKPIPREKIFPVLEKIKKTVVRAPVKTGQVIIKNVLDTGADVVATKTVSKTKNVEG
jgi:CxxC motif-containing protein